MAFSQSEYGGVIEELAGRYEELTRKVDEIRWAADQGIRRAKLDFSGVPGPGGAVLDLVGSGINAIIEGINWLANQLIELVTDAIERIGQLLDARDIPPRMGRAADDWLELVRRPATGVAGQLTPSELLGSYNWQSAAGSAYAAVIPAQAAAANKVGTIADQAATTSVNVANGGKDFYTSLAFALAGFLIGLAGAIATLVSGPIGLAGVLGGITVYLVAIDRAVSEANALNGTLAGELVNLHGELADGSTFPGGSWPKGTAAITSVEQTDGYHTNIELLRTDATKWDAQSGVLAAAAEAKGPLMFPCTQTAVFSEVVLAHYATVSHVTGRCTEGGGELTEIATTLRTVADTYEETERDNEQSMRSIDTP